MGTLSGGQRAQLALSLTLAKRPRLLLLDEPVAALDPLARRQFLATLADAVAVGGLTVVLSSHLVADLERVCDHLILLAASRVQLCGDIDTVLAEHQVLVGPRKDTTAIEKDHTLVQAIHTARQSTLLIRRKRARSSTRPSRPPTSAWKNWCSATWARAPRRRSAHLTAVGEDQ